MKPNIPHHPEDRNDSGLVEQFLADFAHLPADAKERLLESADDQAALPGERLRAWVTAKPRSIGRIYATMLHHLPFGPLLRPLGILFLGGRQPITYVHAAAEVLGMPRALLLLEAVESVNALLEGRDSKFRRLKFGEADIRRELPEPAACEALLAKWMTELVTVAEVVERRLPASFADMEARVRAAEQELETVKKKSAENQAREAKAHARGKEKAIAEAKAQGEASAQQQVADLQAVLGEAKAAAQRVQLELQGAQQRLMEIEQGGGATPERVRELEADINARADDRLRQELSAQLRPWLHQLEAMAAAQAALGEAEQLSLAALDLAMQEAETNDLLLKWKSNRQKALPVIEARLEKLDALMAGLLAPSEKLKALHAQLRTAVLTCRKEAYPTEPLGGLVGAMLAGVKAAKDADMPSIVTALDSLKTAGVLDKDEAESLLRSVNQERQLRMDRSSEKLSTRAFVVRELYARHPMDIYVDAYNFMHTVQQHFGRFAKDSPMHKGKRSFGPEARRHLADMVKVLHRHNVGCRVFLFLDGHNAEGLNPFPGVKFVLPSQQKHGSGQADEEILHYIKANRRPDAMVFVVTNDKAIQTIADKHLSPGEFATMLTEVS
jgi:hypothetical protein